MNARPYRGPFPPRNAVLARFCTYIEYTEVPGGFTAGKGIGILYVLKDGRCVIDPFGRGETNSPAFIFSGMPEGVEVLGEDESE